MTCLRDGGLGVRIIPGSPVAARVSPEIPAEAVSDSGT